MWNCVSCGKTNQDNRLICWHCETGKDGSAPDSEAVLEIKKHRAEQADQSTQQSQTVQSASPQFKRGGGRGDNWKAVFAKNGWKQGDKIVAPKGYTLHLRIKPDWYYIIDDEGTYIDKKNNKPSKEITLCCDDFTIILKDILVKNKTWSFHLWEDIKYVEVRNWLS